MKTMLGSRTKEDPDTAEPSEVVTVMGPVAAPSGTVAVRRVSDPTENEALVDPNSIDVVPARPLPSIVTEAPTAALDGENPSIWGVPAEAFEAAETVRTEAQRSTDKARPRTDLSAFPLCPPGATHRT